jgi:hypothetical protein
MLTEASLSGGFVRTRLQAPALSLIDLELFGTHVSAYVARPSSTGLALEWFEFAPAGISRLLMPLTNIADGSGKRLRLCTSSRTLGAASTIPSPAATVGLTFIDRTISPSLRRIRIRVSAELDGHGSRKEIERLTEDVGEIPLVSLGH